MSTSTEVEGFGLFVVWFDGKMQLLWCIDDLPEGWGAEFYDRNLTYVTHGKTWVRFEDILRYIRHIRQEATAAAVAFEKEHGYMEEPPILRNADWMERDPRLQFLRWLKEARPRLQEFAERYL